MGIAEFNHGVDCWGGGDYVLLWQTTDPEANEVKCEICGEISEDFLEHSACASTDFAETFFDLAVCEFCCNELRKIHFKTNPHLKDWGQ